MFYYSKDVISIPLVIILIDLGRLLGSPYFWFFSEQRWSKIYIIPWGVFYNASSNFQSSLFVDFIWQYNFHIDVDLSFASYDMARAYWFSNQTFSFVSKFSQMFTKRNNSITLLM